MLSTLATAAASVLHVVPLKSATASYVSAGVAAGITLAETAFVLHQARIPSPSLAMMSLWREWPLFFGSASLLASAATSGLPWYRTAHVAAGITGLACVLITTAARTALPVPSKPRLSGPLPVGTATFEVDLPESGRRLAVQAWYPAAPAMTTPSGAPARPARTWSSGRAASCAWEASAVLHSLAGFVGVPRFAFSHLLRARSPAMHGADPRAAPAGAARPLVLCCHGLYGFRFVHSALCAALASEGFVVVAADQWPDSLAAVFPFSRDAVLYDFAVPEHLSGSLAEERKHWQAGTERRVRDATSLLDLLSAAATDAAATDASAPAQREAATDGADAPPGAATETIAGFRLVGDADAPSLRAVLAGCDAGRVLLLGHSYGGGSAVAVSRRDARVAAVACLDPWMWPVPEEDYARPHQPPSLLLCADHWDVGEKQLPWRERAVAPHAGSVHMELVGTGHQNFCDLATMAARPVMRAGDKIGPADPHAAADAVLESVVAFARAHVPAATRIVRAHRPAALWSTPREFAAVATDQALPAHRASVASLLRPYQRPPPEGVAGAGSDAADRALL